MSALSTLFYNPEKKNFRISGAALSSAEGNSFFFSFFLKKTFGLWTLLFKYPFEE